jgi:hypothetical protein
MGYDFFRISIDEKGPKNQGCIHFLTLRGEGKT